MANEELQRKAVEMEYLRAQASEIQKQIISLQEAVKQLEATQASLDRLAEVKKGALMPLGAGVFGKAALQSDDVLVDVGAGAVVQKSPVEAKKTLEERVAAIEKSMLELQQAYFIGAERAEKLAEEIDELVGR